MRFPANCLAVALLRGHVRTRAMRNRAGRLHYFWRDRDGLAWEFYAPCRSRRSYLANLLYVGQVERMPSHDAPPPRPSSSGDDEAARLALRTAIFFS